MEKKVKYASAFPRGAVLFVEGQRRAVSTFGKPYKLTAETLEPSQLDLI